MAEIRLISNLKAVLYYLDTPLLDFEIKERKLIRAIDLNESRIFPPELAILGNKLRKYQCFF